MHASQPQNVEKVRSLLRMAQYVSRFIPEYSTVVQPLRRVTKHDCLWKGWEGQRQAFSELKDRMADWEMLSYFDTKLPTELMMDSSPHGLGAIFTQKKTGIQDSKSWLDLETSQLIISAILSYQNEGKKSILREYLKKETARDEGLQLVMNCIVSGRWHELDAKYAAYKSVKDELSILDGLVLRGERIVPEIL